MSFVSLEDRCACCFVQLLQPEQNASGTLNCFSYTDLRGIVVACDKCKVLSDHNFRTMKHLLQGTWQNMHYSWTWSIYYQWKLCF